MTRGHEVAGRRLRQEFLKFCVVGGVGFLVDAGVLQLCLHAHVLGPVLGRVLSFSLAVLATYELNRRFVFQNAARTGYLRQFLGYLAVQSGGFAINLVVYLISLALLPPPYNHPLICLVIASASALGFNFIAARVLVFR